MNTSFLTKCVLPLLLVFTFLMPTATYAASQDIPAFDGKAVVELNEYVPLFSAEDLAEEDYIKYSRQKNGGARVIGSDAADFFEFLFQR